MKQRQDMQGHSSRNDSGPKAPLWQVAAACLGLAAITIGAFSRTFAFGFVDFDDNIYVYDNPVVVQGLTLKGLIWAFKDDAVDHWHPLTWISHMADCQFFGSQAGYHHLTNVLLHTAAAVLLLLALRELTGSLWRSAFAAALFAVHPLRVESVAWIAERKDVLSGVFFMLALWAYARYAQQPSRGRYVAVAVWFAFGLMCKSTLVTLPFVLLLLDWWPLARLKWNGPILSALVKEKIPFLLISIASCAITVLAPQPVAAAAQIPFLQRLGNAFLSYVTYLLEFVFPRGLATPYPPNNQPGWMIALAMVLVAVIFVATAALWKKQPYLLAGWLWFVGMLVPVIGIVQISDESHADRFTYLPGIGLAIAVAWALGDWSAKWRYRRVAQPCLTAVVLGALIVCSWKQTAYWRNSETLATRALVCTSDNYVAHLILGNALSQQGNVTAAAEQYQQALHINPNYAPAQNNLGDLHLQKDELDEAIRHFKEALRDQPDFTQAHENLANALLRQGHVDEAITHYERAVQIYPDYAEANFNLGNALFQKGRVDEAIGHYERALQLRPEDPKIQNKLVWTLALASLRKGSQAVEWARQANTLTGGKNPVILHALASALAREGRFPEAAETAQHALRQVQAQARAGTQTNAALATQLEEELRRYQSASPPPPGGK